MQSFAPGQRFTSLTEPELGLGIVDEVVDRQVVVSFPARQVTRRYGTSDTPLMRAQLTVGQEVRDDTGNSFRVDTIEEDGPLLVYRCGEQAMSEADLDAHLDVVTPENRLRSAQVDDHRLFQLRRKALRMRHKLLASPARGFLGGRIRLFDHQLSIARDVCDRHRVRVLLADEVGLGKTIEALLILHRLLLTGRVERALVLVPRALVHQWLAEAFLRFNLVLRVLGGDTLASRLFESADDSVPAQLDGSQLCICPLDEDGTGALENEDFDLLIVDEAHHLRPESAAFALVDRLATNIEHVLILSATPDRDGEEAHAQRLRLLDPIRFRDTAAYHDEAAHYSSIADTAERLQRDEVLTDADRALLAERLTHPDLPQLLARSDSDFDARRQLLNRLLDLHGIGRVMFRNVRARIPGFPRRVYCPDVLPQADTDAMHAEFLADMNLGMPPELDGIKRDPRCKWLAQFLDANPDQRVLALCASTEKVEAFARALEGRKRKVAQFHQDMSSIQRDRQAAWFLAEDGPQLLISSAIGAEGRNFQVARHLVLLDLPGTPDRLEQLIGRVDRIGQGEAVFLHTPVQEGTPQARMARWYDALKIFDRPWHGSPVIEREFVGEAIATAAGDSDAEMDELIERGRARNEEVVQQLEGGRDRLLELTSFDVDAAHELSDAIAGAQEDPELEEFMVEAFERAGLKVEAIDHRSYAVTAGVDYHRPFPGFVGTEMGITFDRRNGLRHPERVLLTFDHPMVRDTLDDLLAHEAGNASVALLPIAGQRGLVLEALFLAEPTVARDLRADRFFPPSPLRVVVDSAGREIAFPSPQLDPRLQTADAELLRHETVAPRLQAMQERARGIAAARAPAVAEQARLQMRRELGAAVARLEDMQHANPSTALDAEAAAMRAQLETLDAGLLEFRIRLDALRVILVVPGAAG